VAPYTSARHAEGDVLLFGCESVGLPKDVVARLPAFRIPMTGPVRSINLASAVTVCAYEGMRQVRPGLFE
jgi:tRNA (cytidine/uridine-2'-O-)-methyltransferase